MLSLTVLICKHIVFLSHALFSSHDMYLFGNNLFISNKTNIAAELDLIKINRTYKINLLDLIKF